jgi:hypothetical protein
MQFHPGMPARSGSDQTRRRDLRLIQVRKRIQPGRKAVCGR